jgi:hypothetical protein
LFAVVIFFFPAVPAFGPYITGLMDKRNNERRIRPLVDKNCKGCSYLLENGDVCCYPKMINGLEKRK